MNNKTNVALLMLEKFLRMNIKRILLILKKESKFDAFYYFRQIIDSVIEPSKTRLVFTNLGILLEKDFSLDVPKFLLEYAKDYQVFVLQGPFNLIDGNKLFWNVEVHMGQKDI